MAELNNQNSNNIANQVDYNYYQEYVKESGEIFNKESIKNLLHKHYNNDYNYNEHNNNKISNNIN